MKTNPVFTITLLFSLTACFSGRNKDLRLPSDPRTDRLEVEVRNSNSSFVDLFVLRPGSASEIPFLRQIPMGTVRGFITPRFGIEPYTGISFLAKLVDGSDRAFACLIHGFEWNNDKIIIEVPPSHNNAFRNPLDNPLNCVVQGRGSAIH